MLSDYLAKQLAKAQYKILRDKTYFAEIPGLTGVWANAQNLELCRQELQEVLEDWLILKIRAHESIPGFRIKASNKELAVRYA